jgi:hypothetical protein
MAGPWFTAVERASTSGFGFILPVCGQKVKGIGPSALEVLIGSGEEEPAGPTDRPAITASFGHDLNTRL